ncbi:MAG: efflux RND transporter periplasmic adaptor subunit [Gammaproteobacteria bacterium]|nr:efflux RND transporter periplasmic adaptor subunit [Gammaproteobacteria bacterium]
MSIRRTFSVLSVVLVVVAVIYYVYGVSSTNSNQGPSAADVRPAPVVEVLELKPQNARLWTRFSGRLSAVDSAEIKPLVGGEIKKVLFEDGQIVKQGDPLFVIDPRPHQAAVKRAEAQLASASSRAKLADEELERSRRLVASKLVSESVYDAAKNEHQVSAAAIREAESALVQAQLNLGYCYINAPFDGRVSRAELTVGNIVATTPNAPVLATLVANKQLYAEFNVDEQTYIKSVRSSQDTRAMPVELTLAADESVVYKGHVHSFDNQLNSSSGTIRARAILENVDGVLMPGMFANVRLGSAIKSEVLLIPQKAVGTNQDKQFVYVVDADNKANYRQVTLGAHYNSDRIVLTGLKAGERVVINGLSHIRPNSVVAPKQGHT